MNQYINKQKKIYNIVLTAQMKAIDTERDETCSARPPGWVSACSWSEAWCADRGGAWSLAARVRAAAAASS